MNCYHNLVHSRFIAAASQQLQQARTAIVAEVDMFYESGTHKFDKGYNKTAYYHIGNTYGFFSYMYDDTVEKDKIYYYTYKQFTFAFSTKRKLIDASVLYAYSTNGDVPLYRHKHILKGKTLHTVMFDINFTVPPSSVN